MFMINTESEPGSSLRHQRRFQVGDRVETSNRNHCLGTVIRVDHDELGVFIVVRLDVIPGEFVYDSWELEKVQ